MTNSDSDTLATRRIAAKWTSFLQELDKVYQMRSNPKPDFWSTYDAEERAATEKLKRRPISLFDIENTFTTLRAKVLKAL